MLEIYGSKEIKRIRSNKPHHGSYNEESLRIILPYFNASFLEVAKHVGLFFFFFFHGVYFLYLFYFTFIDLVDQIALLISIGFIQEEEGNKTNKYSYETHVSEIVSPALLLKNQNIES